MFKNRWNFSGQPNLAYTYNQPIMTHINVKGLKFRWLDPESLKEKEADLQKVLELENQLDAKQKLEMEIEESKGKLQLMKLLEDEDDDAGNEQVKDMVAKQKLDCRKKWYNFLW